MGLGMGMGMGPAATALFGQASHAAGTGTGTGTGHSVPFHLPVSLSLPMPSHPSSSSAPQHRPTSPSKPDRPTRPCRSVDGRAHRTAPASQGEPADEQYGVGDGTAPGNAEGADDDEEADRGRQRRHRHRHKGPPSTHIHHHASAHDLLFHSLQSADATPSDRLAYLIDARLVQPLPAGTSYALGALVQHTTHFPHAPTALPAALAAPVPGYASHVLRQAQGRAKAADQQAAEQAVAEGRLPRHGSRDRDRERSRSRSGSRSHSRARSSSAARPSHSQGQDHGSGQQSDSHGWASGPDAGPSPVEQYRTALNGHTSSEPTVSAPMPVPVPSSLPHPLSTGGPPAPHIAAQASNTAPSASVHRHPSPASAPRHTPSPATMYHRAEAPIGQAGSGGPAAPTVAAVPVTATHEGRGMAAAAPASVRTPHATLRPGSDQADAASSAHTVGPSYALSGSAPSAPASLPSAAPFAPPTSTRTILSFDSMARTHALIVPVATANAGTSTASMMGSTVGRLDASLYPPLTSTAASGSGSVSQGPGMGMSENAPLPLSVSANVAAITSAVGLAAEQLSVYRSHVDAARGPQRMASQQGQGQCTGPLSPRSAGSGTDGSSGSSSSGHGSLSLGSVSATTALLGSPHMDAALQAAVRVPAPPSSLTSTHVPALAGGAGKTCPPGAASASDPVSASASSVAALDGPYTRAQAGAGDGSLDTTTATAGTSESAAWTRMPQDHLGALPLPVPLHVHDYHVDGAGTGAGGNGLAFVSLSLWRRMGSLHAETDEVAF